MGDITLLADQAIRGDLAAQNRLVDEVYTELRQLAAREFHREASGNTLQPTALVHEAFMRLFGNSPVSIQSRQHFFHLAARTMRRVLVDHARQKRAAKRPPGHARVELQDEHLDNALDTETILSIHHCLDQLQQADPRLVTVVELRFFGGLSVEETAQAMGISETSVKRDFAAARAFLEREMNRAGSVE